MIGCVEAEAAFLGSLLMTGTSWIATGYLSQVEAEDFTDPRHRAVLEGMRQLVEAGGPVDPIALQGQLRRSGLERSMTDDRSAGVFLADLCAIPPSVGWVGHYLLVVLEHRVRRAVEAAAGTARRRGITS